MTAKIKQNVIPRNRRQYAFMAEFFPARSTGKTNQGIWQARRRQRAHSNKVDRTSATRWQTGSVDQSTITLGFAIISLVGLVILGFIYLHQVFGTAVQGNDIHALERRIIELSERQNELELEGAELRSIQNVEQHVDQLNLVSSSDVAYLSVQPKKVAQFSTNTVR